LVEHRRRDIEHGHEDDGGDRITAVISSTEVALSNEAVGTQHGDVSVYWLRDNDGTAEIATDDRRNVRNATFIGDVLRYNNVGWTVITDEDAEVLESNVAASINSSVRDKQSEASNAAGVLANNTGENTNRLVAECRSRRSRWQGHIQTALVEICLRWEDRCKWIANRDDLSSGNRVATDICCSPSSDDAFKDLGNRITW
jgi:hypothetical protein